MWIILLSLFQDGIAVKLNTFFLNSGHSFLNPIPEDLPDIECLHTDMSNIIPMKNNITVCYRMQPMKYTGEKESWSTIVSFGTIQPDFQDLEEGMLIGTWEHETWFAIKNRTNKSFAWKSLGKNFMHDVQIWRHTCVSINIESRYVQLFENGKKRLEARVESIQRIGDTLNHVAAGCLYRSSKYLSMYGRVICKYLEELCLKE